MARTRNTADTATTQDPAVVVESDATATPTDWTAVAVAAATAFASDRDGEKFTAVYRTIPSGARRDGLTNAMYRASGDAMGDLLTVVTDMPAATTSRATLRDLTDAEKLDIRVHAAAAACGVDGIAGESIEKLVADGFAGVIATVIVRMEKAIASVTIGQRTRTHIAGSLAELLADGTLSAGDPLTHKSGAVATLEADGTVTFAGTNYDSISGAAVACADGTSSNGWRDFYTADGVALTTLR